jgi:hypothetical protein
VGGVDRKVDAAGVDDGAECGRHRVQISLTRSPACRRRRRAGFEYTPRTSRQPA